MVGRGIVDTVDWPAALVSLLLGTATEWCFGAASKPPWPVVKFLKKAFDTAVWIGHNPRRFGPLLRQW